MTAAAIDRATYVFRFGPNEAVRWEETPRRTLPAHLEAAEPERWAWCLHCERAFQLGEAREEHGAVMCAYLDCEASPLDFWLWESYRAFVGAAPRVPRLGLEYPLARAA
jgi:hypothetical protein